MGTKEGNTNCLDVMTAIQGEGETIFTWGQTAGAYHRMVHLCNQDTAFQGKNGVVLLSLTTAVKKLADWITFFTTGQQG
jgi:hypothetical protein